MIPNVDIGRLLLLKAKQSPKMKRTCQYPDTEIELITTQNSPNFKINCRSQYEPEEDRCYCTKFPKTLLGEKTTRSKKKILALLAKFSSVQLRMSKF